ncbi:MAG TPA: SRPBCC domain-containing protein [Longimicrobiales bacterium]|jgi:uncharacterized protein YndB with AHSA1/START domain
MTKTGDDTRSLEITRDVAASPEAVWQAISQAEELARWFPLEARVTPGEGGSIWLSWGPGCEGEAPIRVWEPGRRLSWTEEFPDGSGGVIRLAVDFHVEGRSGGTVVRLVHSGFGAGAEWDDHYDGVKAGWTYFLLSLAWYLERHPGRPRGMVWIRRPTELTRPQVWRRLLGPGGVGRVTSPDAAEAGQPFNLALPGSGAPGEVVIADRPFTFAATCPGLDDGLLFLEMEGRGEGRWHCGVWLSTWGLPPERVAALQVALDAVGDGIFGEVG